MYLYINGIDFASSFYDFSFGFWNCCDSVVFFVFHFINILKELINLCENKYYLVIILQKSASAFLPYALKCILFLLFKHQCSIFIQNVCYILSSKAQATYEVFHIIIFLYN